VEVKSRNKEFDLLVFEGGDRGLTIQVSQQANICGQSPQAKNRWVEDGRAFQFVELTKRQALRLAADLLDFAK